VLVAMNRPSLEKFLGDVVPGGLVLYDAAMGEMPGKEGVKMLAVPAHEIAEGGGSARATNTAMLGVMAGLAGFGIADEHYLDAIAKNFAAKPKLVPVNEAVFAAGKAWAQAHI
jgi:2-oxoisovalerate ferredoxin oxidoreductase beta subunit